MTDRGEVAPRCVGEVCRLLHVLQASIGIANLLVMAMQEQGMSVADAISKIWLVDSRGLVTKVLFYLRLTLVATRLSHLLTPWPRTLSQTLVVVVIVVVVMVVVVIFLMLSDAT